MTSEQIRIRYESKFIDSEYMLKKRASQLALTFKELKIYESMSRTPVTSVMG